MHWEHERRVRLTLTRNLTLTLRSSIKSRIKSESESKSKISSDESEAGVILTTRFMEARISPPQLELSLLQWEH